MFPSTNPVLAIHWASCCSFCKSWWNLAWTSRTRTRLDQGGGSSNILKWVTRLSGFAVEKSGDKPPKLMGFSGCSWFFQLLCGSELISSYLLGSRFDSEYNCLWQSSLLKRHELGNYPISRLAQLLAWLSNRVCLFQWYLQLNTQQNHCSIL